VSLAADPRLATQLDGQTEGSSRVIWLVSLGVFLFLVWASLAPLDQIVRAQGEMVSTSRAQIIQNLEGGILAELAVQEGDLVEAGDVLARLHGTPYQTSVDDLENQIAALSIRKIRLEGEQAGQFDLTVPTAFDVRLPDIVASERALLAARQTDYMKRREGAQLVLEQTAKEKALMEALLEEKIVALIEVTRARKTHADAQVKYDEIVTQTELERAKAYSDTLKELSTLQQNVKTARDQLQRTILTAPLRGIVKGLAVTTIGGVVQPGQEIAQIIPLGEDVFVEARVAPEDIAGVRAGQAATVKLSAYDYTVYGTLSGEVTLVSADTFKDARTQDGDPHYRVTVAVDMDRLTERQTAIAIRPGMLAEVELHTGSKTVLQYLLRPLYKSQEALREP
jgi:adhesin transport system membrane fusion protein